jgi:4-amino-4-deoxy-L-arabinose transferase-like glycosyltransferase
MRPPSVIGSEMKFEKPAPLTAPEIWLATLLCAQLVFWTAIPWLFSSSLPLDVVSDGLAWGHEWQWGYFKHPPLPSWAAEIFFDAFGQIGPYLLSQIAIVTTYIFVFLLGRAFLPARWAAVGALLQTGVYYFSIPTPEFNHNVAQMPIWAAAGYFYYKGWKSGQIYWWIGLGVAAALGILAKYSTALLLATIIVHCLCTRSARAKLGTAGPYVAIGVCIAIISPHLAWLIRSGFPTLHYAVGRAGNATSAAVRIVAPYKFLLAQLIDIAPAFVAAGIAGLLSRNALKLQRDENLNFLLWLTLGPPLITFLLSLVTGFGTRDMWGAPMWNFIGLVIVMLAGERRDLMSFPRLAFCISALFAIGLGGYLLANVFVPEWQSKPSRIQWPAREMAERFSADWESREHEPLQIVAGDGWLGGLIAMDAKPRPSVWTDASFVKSPWITQARVAQQGALVVWRIRDNDNPPAPLAQIPGLHLLGVEAFDWPSTPKARQLRIGYGIVAPRSPTR